MTFRRASLLALLFVALAHSQSETIELQGTLIDARSGLPISGAQIVLKAPDQLTSSDNFGRFRIQDVLPGHHLLQVTSLGYFPSATDLFFTAIEQKAIQISLTPQLQARVDAVNVTGSNPDLPNDASFDRVSLSGDDLKNLSTVLADDPLRALQGLPGVAANDDFGAQFTLRGADFNRIGIYLDGIKLHNVLHSLEGTDLSGSASSFNTALVGQLDLYESAYSEKFADSSAGALDVRLRDGAFDRYHLSVSANFGTAGFAAAGPLGKLNRCSWIGGFRKSFLQYLLARTLTDPSLAFGIEDEQGRLTCHVTPHNTASLEIIDSRTILDRSSVKNMLGADSLMLANQHVFTANLSWIYSPTDRLQIASHVAWMPDNYDAKNPVSQPLGSGAYSEKAWNTNATWMENAHASSSVGFSLRAIGENGFAETYNTVHAVRLYDAYRGVGTLSGGYFAENWTGLRDALHLTASGRWDHHSVDGVTTFSPQAGASIRLLPSLTLQVGFGQYVQFPELSVFGSTLGVGTLLPIRSNQAAAALEQHLPWNARLKVEYYNRNDRNLLYQPTADPRLINGQVYLSPINPAYTNSLRSKSSGVELYLQRTSASGVGGWISYAYGKTSMYDGVTHDTFPSDWDQRHALNIYATYRLRPTVNLSAKWTYGSGFPAPGYLQLNGAEYYLSNNRNQLRIGPYQRVDVRVNKTWHSEKWKKSLFVEVMNVTNKTNSRFGSLDGYSPSTGVAFVTVDTMFPILPTVGFVIER